jgi:hypothetical protein
MKNHEIDLPPLPEPAFTRPSMVQGMDYGFYTAEQTQEYARAALVDVLSRGPVCTACGGNDGNMPCAYPSQGKPGCLRDARLAAAPSVSKGYKLVPVKPDDAMIEAALSAHEPLDGDDLDYRAEFKRTYHAMVAAAPEAPAMLRCTQ